MTIVIHLILAFIAGQLTVGLMWIRDIQQHVRLIERQTRS